MGTTESRVALGGAATPAAESTHVFRLVNRVLSIVSLGAIFCAATAESAALACGGMNVVNWAAAVAGRPTINESMKRRWYGTGRLLRRWSETRHTTGQKNRVEG
jgi:hypothetical protein